MLELFASLQIHSCRSKFRSSQWRQRHRQSLWNEKHITLSSSRMRLGSMRQYRADSDREQVLSLVRPCSRRAVVFDEPGSVPAAEPHGRRPVVASSSTAGCWVVWDGCWFGAAHRSLLKPHGAEPSSRTSTMFAYPLSRAWARAVSPSPSTKSRRAPVASIRPTTLPCPPRAASRRAV